MPGRRPDERRAGRAQRSAPSALRGGGTRADLTRRLLDERRARIEDGGGQGGARGGGPRRPGGGGRGSRDPAREQRFRRRRIAAIALAGAALIGIWFLFSLFQPFKGEGEGPVEVTIPQGSSIGEIGDLLEEQGVISSSFFFQLRARLGDGAESLQAGEYTLAEGMSYGAALEQLTTGSVPGQSLSVTIPEGLSRSEIAPIVKDAGLDGNYERATVESKALDPADYGAKGAESLEGFLFPSTYELKKKATVENLVRKQLKAFERKFEKVDLGEAEEANLTPYDVLTIASMVERETMLDRERPLVASVIYNRLQDGEPLGIDATIRFALDNWTDPLTDSDLAVDSPYNTRQNAGLPPGPIGNPGLDSIEAAADPADTDFRYYVFKPGTCGKHVFTDDYDEFLAASEEYEQAREEAGFRSPDTCKEQ